MKNGWMVFIWAAVLTAAAMAQTSAAAPSVSTDQTSTATLSLSSGTAIVAAMAKSVDAKKAKAGDTVKATVVQDVVSRGRLVIRKGSKLVGHVAEVKSRSQEDPESRLAITFDKALLKGGGELAFNGGIRALGAPHREPSLVDQPDQMLPPRIAVGNPQGGNGPQPLGKSTAPAGRGTGTSGVGNPQVNPANDNAAGKSVNSDKLPYVSAGLNQGPPPERGGLLSAGNRGVFGLPGLALSANGGQNSVITSKNQNVKLESNVQVVVVINGPVQQ